MKECYLVILILLVGNAYAQQTGGHLTGYITDNGNPVENAFILLSTQSKKEKYTSYSNKNGYYQFNNIHAGEGYKITVISINLDSVGADNIEILLGETVQLNFAIDKKTNRLQDIIVKSSIAQKGSQFSVKTSKELATTSGIHGGLFQPFPSLQILQNGGLSISQQNPRLNAYYIDGAVQNDIFGLGATGIAGAQTLGFPIQKEEVEQIQVISTPFDASVGNFIGGAINITTKAGTNKAKQSYFWESGWGRIAQQKKGLQLSGPLIQNKLFYAVAINELYYKANQPFDFSTYRGDIQTEKQWQLAANTIQALYNYDIGNPDFIDERENRKLSIRLDWLLPKNQKIVFSFRTFQYSRATNTMSTPTSIHFSNSAKKYSGGVTYGNIEYKKWWRKSSNRLLFSIYKNRDISKSGNASFPALRILDGDGFLYAGNQPDAMQNELMQTQFFIYNRFQTAYNKYTISVGTEIHHSIIQNSFLPNNYGTYFYYSLANLLQNHQPGAYERNIFAISTNPIKYSRAAVFSQVEKKIYKNIQIQAGIRITLEQISTQQSLNNSFNKDILPTMLTIHQEDNTEVGKKISIQPAATPRLSFTYTNTSKGIWIQGGTGLFTGTIPLAWLSGVTLYNGINANTFNASNSALKYLRFNPDPLLQWQPNQFADSFAKPTINLVSDQIKMPTIWKTSIQIKKNFKRNITVQTVFSYFVNRQEISFKNIGLPEPANQMIGVDNRMIYDSTANIMGYNKVYLLTNTKKASGYGYQLELQIRKNINNGTLDLAYVWGDAFSLYDGNYNVVANQWKLNESVEGRNYLKRSRSDYSMGTVAQVNYRHIFKINKKQIGIQLTYTGSAGDLMSYVYGKKNLVQDDLNSPGFDLIYIPTISDLQQQQFVPIISEGLYYTSGLQKEMLNLFIEENTYLKNRRGLYAERNGSRQPFRHQLNLSIDYNGSFTLYRNKIWMNLYIQLYNLQEWLLPATKLLSPTFSSRVPIINFMGFVPGSFVPTYSFNPAILEKRATDIQLSASRETDRFFFVKTGLSLSFY